MKEYGLVKKVDAGPIFGTYPLKINYKKSVLWHHAQLYLKGKYCAFIKQELDKRGIKYSEIDAEEFHKEWEFIKNEYDVSTVPTSVVNGIVISGSDKVDEIEKTLNNS